MKRLAVIDIGTNTFHLLIVGDLKGGAYNEIYRERAYVKLGEEGIDHIGRAAFRRGLETLEKFRGVMDMFEIVDYRACATEALRKADNAEVFLRRAERECGIKAEVISGEREAELIFRGVRQSGACSDEASLIMDIGGGSIEFIYCREGAMLWSESLAVGAAVLYKEYQREEPLGQGSELELRAALKRSCAGVIEKLVREPPAILAGASGTFDVLAEAVGQKTEGEKYSLVKVGDFRDFYSSVRNMDLDERLSFPPIPEKRADLIVVALILIDFVLEVCRCDEIRVSPFSLKEGLIEEMLEAYHQKINSLE